MLERSDECDNGAGSVGIVPFGAFDDIQQDWWQSVKFNADSAMLDPATNAISSERYHPLHVRTMEMRNRWNHLKV